MIDITDFHTYPIKLREAKSSFDNLPNTVIEEIINSNYLNDYLEHEIFYQKRGDLHRLAKK